MLAVAHPKDDNWNKQTSSMSRTPQSVAKPTSSASLASPLPSKESQPQYQISSAAMSSTTSSNGTVIPQSSMNGPPSSSKPLVRSKSRGSSVGGFVHGLVNGVQASLRNVGHKNVPSAPTNGYHSDHHTQGKLFKTKSPGLSSPSNHSNSPEAPNFPDQLRDQSSPSKSYTKALARTHSKSRAYESEGDNHTIGAIRHSKPNYPPISTSFNRASPTERVPKSNGHAPMPLSPLSRESSRSPPTSALSSVLNKSVQSQSPSSSVPVSPSYTMRGPVPRSAARAVLELDAIPAAELLKVLAALLEQIAAANDILRAERAARGEDTWDEQAMESAKQESDLAPKQKPPLTPESPTSTRSRSRSQRRGDVGGPPVSDTPIWDHLTTASRAALSSRTSTLSFHARHIPQISLEAYLLRILKYCPTANTTFVAVLVYFDRMCRLAGNVENERYANAEAAAAAMSSKASKDPNVPSEKEEVTPPKKRPGFAIDSYNVHRLVIAGVTVASKFFSDVFYTNSRYAKVGGLPQSELNQLELQFLLLNGFELVIPPEELARYAAQLIVYAQGRNIDLKPEGLGKGKIGYEAKVVLGLVPEPEPMPMSPIMSSDFSGPPSGASYGGTDSAEQTRSPTTPSRLYNQTVSRPTSSNTSWSGNGGFRANYGLPGYYQNNRSMGEGMDIAHDSETEVSTDEDSTIKARSGSESEASEWGVGSTGDEGEGDDTGAETETEGEDELHGDVHDRNPTRHRSIGNGSRNASGRTRGVSPSLGVQQR